jgi:hypothetical protein
MPQQVCAAGNARGESRHCWLGGGQGAGAKYARWATAGAPQVIALQSDVVLVLLRLAELLRTLFSDGA